MALATNCTKSAWSAKAIIIIAKKLLKKVNYFWQKLSLNDDHLLSLLHSPLTLQYCNLPSTVFIIIIVIFLLLFERERELDKDSTAKFFVIYKNDITEGLKAKKGLP